jgi:hypothetical protein
MYNILLGEHKGKWPLGRTGGRWNVNIKIEHTEISVKVGNETASG